VENPAVADGGYNNDRASPSVGIVERFINSVEPDMSQDTRAV
jgi:hypothetical protein